MSSQTQHHKSDRAGGWKVDGRRERCRTDESALSRSDWVCYNVRQKLSRIAVKVGVLVVAVLLLLRFLGQADRGTPVTVSGITGNAKMGAIVVLSESGQWYYLDGMHAWSSGNLGKRVSVSGRLVIDDRYMAREGSSGTTGQDRFILDSKVEFLGDSEDRH